MRNTLFLFHFQFSSVCILAICLCMHVCLCAVYRTRGSISNMCRYKNLRASIFCFAVRNYKFLNLAHTYWHVQSRFLHVALVLVVVLLLETMVLVVLVFVLVLVVLLVLVGAAGAGGGGGGSVGRMNFGTSFAPRSPTSFAPRHNCNKVRVLFYCFGLRATITLQRFAKRCYQWKHCSFCALPCRLDLSNESEILKMFEWIVECAIRVGGAIS